MLTCCTAPIHKPPRIWSAGLPEIELQPIIVWMNDSFHGIRDNMEKGEMGKVVWFWSPTCVLPIGLGQYTTIQLRHTTVASVVDRNWFKQCSTNTGTLNATSHERFFCYLVPSGVFVLK